MIIGVPLGTLLGLVRVPGRGAITVGLYTGMGLPPVVVGLFVYLMLSRSGPFGPLGWLFTPKAMVVAQSIIALPLVAGLTLTAVQAVDPALRVQVRSLGATAHSRRPGRSSSRRGSAWSPQSSPRSAASSRKSAR